MPRFVVVLGLLAVSHARAGVAPSVEEISLDARANIMEESHFGVVNGRISVGIPHRTVLAVRGLYVQSFASSDFALDVRLFCDRVATSDYRWYHLEVRRTGLVRAVGRLSRKLPVELRRTLGDLSGLRRGRGQSAHQAVPLHRSHTPFPVRPHNGCR